MLLFEEVFYKYHLDHINDSATNAFYILTNFLRAWSINSDRRALETPTVIVDLCSPFSSVNLLSYILRCGSFTSCCLKHSISFFKLCTSSVKDRKAAFILLKYEKYTVKRNTQILYSTEYWGIFWENSWNQDLLLKRKISLVLWLLLAHYVGLPNLSNLSCLFQMPTFPCIFKVHYICI